MLKRKIVKDDLYQTTIIYETDYKYIMPDINTAIKMFLLAEKHDKAVKKIEAFTNEEEFENARQKILDYPLYSQKDKDYLIAQIELQKLCQ